MLSLAILMAIVEIFGAIVGAVACRRSVLTYFALGFAASMAIFDMLPDAATSSSLAYPLFLLGLAFVSLAWYLGERVRFAAVLGMGFHDFFEGVLASFALTPLTAAALILHKLPEGMAVLALLEGNTRSALKVVKVIPVALLIPAGALVGEAFSGFSVLIAFCAGIVFGTTVRLMIETSGNVSTSSAASAVAGAIIAALTALVV